MAATRKGRVIGLFSLFFFSFCPSGKERFVKDETIQEEISCRDHEIEIRSGERYEDRDEIEAC